MFLVLASEQWILQSSIQLISCLLLLGRSAKYEEALEKFESVLGSKPEPDEASVASYNVACCYAKLNQVGDKEYIASFSCIIIDLASIYEFWPKEQTNYPGVSTGTTVLSLSVNTE